MFWNKPKKEAPVTTDINTPTNYVRNSDVMVVRKMDDIDLEFIRRYEHNVYKRIMDNKDDTYYITKDIRSHHWTVINQYILDNEYTKIGE